MARSTFAIATVLACLMLLCSADMVYYQSCGDQNTRSSFNLPYLYASSVVTAIIDLQGGSNSYNVELWQPLSYPPNTPDQQTSLTGTAQFTSAPLSVPGIWRLVVTPQGNAGLQFAFKISISANNQSIAKNVDIARYSRVFTLYHSSGGSHSVKLSVPNSLAGMATLYLYGPFDTLTVAGGMSIANNSQAMSTTINYQTSGRQYYYIEVVQTDQMTESTVYINVQYVTDQYQCPFTAEFKDVNGVYAGCSNTLPTYGFPCINYDNVLNTCIGCASPWIVNSQGVCQSDTSCPAGQYFSFGSCQNAIDNCLNFQPIGGTCLSCNSGFTLQNYNNGSQACKQNTQICQSNQYLLGTTCMNYVNNCANFQTTTGQCLNCQQGYSLDQNLCSQVVIQSADCQLGYKSVNGYCKAIDQNCIFYYNTNTCMLCARGYVFNGSCQKLICLTRQYSGTNSCLDVSPLCNTFDAVYGNCLTCIQSYYLQADGTCLQSVPSQNGVVATNNCPDGYYSRQGTCVQVNPLCRTYSITTGVCTTCLDTTYFLNSVGACILISDYCGYRTYFSQGKCLPVSVLCDTYDSTTGFCLTCRDSTILTGAGTCIYNENCESRQYHLQDGSCSSVSPSCGDFDQTTGICLTCADSTYQLNTGGICCYKFNYMIDTNCTVFYTTNCLTQHSTFHYCLKCATGFSLTNGVFGRCN